MLQKIGLKNIKKCVENHDYCFVEMLEEHNKILKYKHGEKSVKAPAVIYFDLECSLERINTCHSDPEKSITTKMNKHTPSGYSLFTRCSFDSKENKLDCYRGEACTKKFCEDLKKYVKRIINYEKKEMILLTKKEQNMHDKAKACHICKERFSTDLNNEKYHKVRDHCHYTGKYRGAAHAICNLRCKIPKEISVIAHNASTYNYHLIIKELAKEFEGTLECLSENTEKYIT